MFSEYKVLTVGPALGDRGGISSVLSAYRRNFPDFAFAATNSRHGTIAGAFVLAWLLVRLPFFRLSGYRILHAHSAAGKSFVRKRIILAWARALGYRTVFHIHSGYFAGYARKEGLEKIGAILRNYDAVAALSPAMADGISTSLGCATVDVIPNIVEAPDTPPAKQNSNGPLQLIFLGKICRDKGIFDLLETLSAGRGRYSGRLVLNVGGAGDDALFDAETKRLGLGSMVRKLGWIGSEAKRRLLQKGGVMVLPSYVEGMPITLLEAGAYALPSIASRAGAITELIEDNANGILIDAGDRQALAAAIDRYLSDPALRRRHGDEARRRIEPHLPHGVAKALENIYRRL